MDFAYELAWLHAFLFTQAVEVPVYVAGLRRLGGQPRWRAAPGPLPLVGRLLLALLLSAVTHPVVWFVWPRLVTSYPIMVACAEVFALTVEALLLAASGCRRPLLLSFLANAASFGLGELSRRVFHLP
ncbi:MAG: hypothetical protein U1A78_19380 [Polyangia bacterium]